MPVPATCPFCNALIPASAPVVAGWVVCPRCGENVGTGSSAQGAHQSGRAGTESAEDARPRSGRRTLALAVAVVLIGVAAWLAVTNWERLRSPFGRPTPPARPVVVQPADLPGLGYLPESTEAVLAVQMQFLLQRLGPDAGQDPVRALTALGLPQQAAELLDGASAVGLRNVDHLVVGLAFEDHALPPQMTVVIHATQPFDLEGIARREKARALKRDDRTLYATKAGPLPALYWWKAADRVLVATILAKDLDAVPSQPRAGTDQLRPAVTGLMRDALAADACAWFAAASDKWDQYLKPYTLPFVPTPLQGRNDLLKPAERLRSMSLSVPNDAGKPIDVRIGLKSADAAATLRGTLAERFRGEPVEVSGDDEWARLSVPNDPGRIGPLIGRLMTGGK